MTPVTRTQPTPDTLGIARSVLRVINKELTLAKAEMSENLSRAVTAVVVLIAGGALSIFALAALVWAAAAGLMAAGLPAWGAALAVAGALAFAALAAIAWALRNLTAERLAPTRSLTNVQRDLGILKEAFDG
ncbi:MAG: phage holin family protein [Pseudomonadota bacterium]